MKRVKLAAIAFAFAALIVSCGEDTIMEEIIADSELSNPTFETEDSKTQNKPPRSN